MNESRPAPAPSWGDQSLKEIDDKTNNTNSLSNCQTVGSFDRCHRIDIAQRSDYELIKPFFDRQMSNLKVPGGIIYWPKIEYYEASEFNQVKLYDLVIFKDSYTNCEYGVKVFGIEPMICGSEISQFGGNECMLCKVF